VVIFINSSYGALYISFSCEWVYQIIKFSWQICRTARSRKTHDFLFLNINILILHYASIQSEIDGPSETDLLKQYISKLKARIVKLEDKMY